MFAQYKIVLPVVWLVCLFTCPYASGEESSLELFRSRIAPILQSPQATSCKECHLGGVDLKDYIGETQEETFAALTAAGLVDVENPDKSKLLEFIQREPENSSAIRKEIREREFEAFRAWLRVAATDPKLAAASVGKDQLTLGPKLPVEVIRHSRKDRVMQAFTENIWSEMGRCVGCHSPELNRKKIGRNGHTEKSIDAISWVVPRDPAATLAKLVDSGNIDLDDPEASEFLTKPAGLEEHGGGPKFAIGSRTDKNFRRFLVDYAALMKGDYKTADQLPEAPVEVSATTGQFLRITGLPLEFDKKLLRVDIYRREGDAWSTERWATAENGVVGKRHLWQSPLFAVAQRDGARAKEWGQEMPLPSGRYRIKIFVDKKNQTKTDRDYELGEADYIGEVETNGEWAMGFKTPTVVHAPK